MYTGELDDTVHYTIRNRRTQESKAQAEKDRCCHRQSDAQVSAEMDRGSRAEEGGRLARQLRLAS